MSTELCIAIISMLSVFLLISLAFNIKSFRSFSKAYMLRWQWFWSVEERPAADAAVEGASVAKSDNFYKVTALILAVLVIVGIVVGTIWYNAQ